MKLHKYGYVNTFYEIILDSLILTFCKLNKNRNTIVDMVTGLWAEQSDILFLTEARVFLFFESPRPALRLPAPY